MGLPERTGTVTKSPVLTPAKWYFVLDSNHNLVATLCTKGGAGNSAQVKVK